MTAKNTRRLLRPLALSLSVSAGTCLVLFLFRVAASEDWRYSYLLWNLFLAGLPLLFAGLLLRRLKKGRWLAWQNLALTALWLGFLPNSFYILSDFIHLESTGEVSLLYDIVMYASFIFNGFSLGFISLFLVHRQLLVRLHSLQANSLVALVLFLCSFAIYLGRYLRWNSWDVLINPAGLLFDVSDRIINPAAHPQAFITTSTFFVLLGSIYLVLWQAAQVLSTMNPTKP
jgi:uncharacterized membrane protein